MISEVLMNRIFSTLAVLAMLLFATGLCVKQTFDARESVDNMTLTVLFSAEGLVAGLVIAAAVSLLRRRFARRKKEEISGRQVPATV
jgi:hypothetical protein